MTPITGNEIVIPYFYSRIFRLHGLYGAGIAALDA